MRWILLLSFWILFTPEANAFAPWEKYKADGLYNQSKYAEAAKAYEALLKENPNQPELQYNLGDAYYRLSQFEAAHRAFEQALNAADPKIREQALYNLGNTQYRENQLQPAVDSYNKVLEMNPDNEKAKANRDFVLKKLEEQKQNEQQQPPPPEENKDEQNEEQNKEEPQQPKDQQDKKDEQNQGSQNPQDSKNENESDSKKNPQNPGEQKQQEPPGPPEQKEGQAQNSKPDESPAQPGGGAEAKPQKPLSQEEAERWLQSIQDDPKGAMKEMIRQEAGSGSTQRIEKDW